MSHPTEPQIEAIRQYLEREFPGQVQHVWWDEDANAPIFEVTYETGRHHVLMDERFMRTSQDPVASLRASELADYMREARAQDRRFLIRVEGGTVHIRSTSL
jgi:hypothetical protein